MAAIHPSRMGLIDPSLRDSRLSSPSSREERGRHRLPRSRSRSPDRRSRSRDRRRSPDYGEYQKRSRPSEDSYGRGPRGGSGNEWLDQRRKQRENAKVDPWPPSPKAPAQELSSKGKRRSKRNRSSSPSSSESSSDERNRKRRRKDKKRAKKEGRREKHRHSRSASYDDGRRRHSTRSKSRNVSLAPVGADEWVEKSATPSSAQRTADNPNSSKLLSSANSPPGSESDDEIGPKPAAPNKGQRIDERTYGGSLLRGEGSAMAAFLQGEEGTEARIPRRGEIGLDSEEIARFEDAGYVMSGNRHHRMNAVRMRKENQVISAEEKRQMLTLQKEERERKEAILREEFNELVTEKLKKVGVGPDTSSGK
ncbi:ras-induced vulval development antagonist-domain-containing protein [Flagelloscypha sp. PMI_526]|nr:ras-induced vulval development antagonist-domain-containing protein [Flagelloscypha sp. PMI_526]